jgi:hypothetical protein
MTLGLLVLSAVAETDTQFYGVGAFLLAASAVASITEG